MPDEKTNQFVISVDDFDSSLLPPNARSPGTDEFAAEVSKVLQQEYSEFGGWAQIVVSDDEIQVRWREGSKNPLSQALAHFPEDYPAGIRKLRSLLRQSPGDIDLLYNLGIALSDIGELDAAEATLQQAVEVEPGHVNSIVGLGVAQQRAKRTDEAIATLKQAVKEGPDNAWAHRNLAACLLSVGRPEEALTHLQQATKLNPGDQQAWFGLGQAQERIGDGAAADVSYERAIKLDSGSDIAELAKQRRSQIGQAVMRERVGGGIRPDAVMYCLGALERFSAMPREELQRCVFEIAMKGQSGFDFNDPTPKYSFRSLDGDYSGLHALSLMYVGFRFIDPTADMGFDLTKEYEAAKGMFPGDAP